MTNQPTSVRIPGRDGRSDHVIVFARDLDSMALWVDDALVAGLTEGATAQVEHMCDSLDDKTRTAGIALPAVDEDGTYTLVFDPDVDHLIVYGPDGETPVAAVMQAHSAVSFLAGRA